MESKSILKIEVSALLVRAMIKELNDSLTVLELPVDKTGREDLRRDIGSVRDGLEVLVELAVEMGKEREQEREEGVPALSQGALT